MSQFRGKFTNRLDGKGRVSVPAAFRPLLDGTFVLRRSTRRPCLEGWPVPSFSSNALLATPMDELTPEHDELAYALYSDTVDLSMDPEGRVLLPKEYKEFAGISDSVSFLGRPGFFELWEPAAAEAVIAQAREAYEARARARLEAHAARGTAAPDPAP